MAGLEAMETSRGFSMGSKDGESWAVARWVVVLRGGKCSGPARVQLSAFGVAPSAPKLVSV